MERKSNWSLIWEYSIPKRWPLCWHLMPCLYVPMVNHFLRAQQLSYFLSGIFLNGHVFSGLMAYYIGGLSKLHLTFWYNYMCKCIEYTLVWYKIKRKFWGEKCAGTARNKIKCASQSSFQRTSQKAITLHMDMVDVRSLSIVPSLINFLK